MIPDWSSPVHTDRALCNILEKLCLRYQGEGAVLYLVEGEGRASRIRSIGKFGFDADTATAIASWGQQIMSRNARAVMLPSAVDLELSGRLYRITLYPGYPDGLGRQLLAFVSRNDLPFTTLAETYLASLAIMDSVVTGSVLQQREPEKVRLTDREKTCLKWTANGKTSEEISIILGLSQHTVNHYLTNATKKLDAANRTHAVIKAFQSKLI